MPTAKRSRRAVLDRFPVNSVPIEFLEDYVIITVKSVSEIPVM